MKKDLDRRHHGNAGTYAEHLEPEFTNLPLTIY
jgi:hypothetical protein